MQNVVKFRKCRKCKNNLVIESRKHCDSCKLEHKTCNCGQTFRSNKHIYCKLCRNSQGNNGICDICNNHRHIYYNSGVCTTCYKFMTKYSLNKKEFIYLRSITHCQLCGTHVIHSNSNNKGQAVIDHDHKTGKIRGVLCVNCNVIEGMIRDIDHLEVLYQNYKSYLKEKL